MGRMKVRCEVCEDAFLSRVEDGEVDGYLCDNFKDHPAGESCHQLVLAADVKERWEEEERERAKAMEKEESENDDDDDEDDEEPEPMSMNAIREANIKALVAGTVTVKRAPLIPKLLSVEETLRRPFKSPHPNAPDRSAALVRKLAARKVFVPWGGPRPARPPTPSISQSSGEDKDESVAIDPAIEPCVVWEPGEDAEPGAKPITVDPMLLKWLRPHQREGVKFMFECVTGQREFNEMQGHGCILADDMGLGKTLQGITLTWTMLKQGFDGKKPLASRVVVVCPTSLVTNWDSEFDKFLCGRVKTLPIAEASKAEAERSMRDFLNPRGIYQVMMVSYETFRIYAHMFEKEGTCDLLICDEAHRLKNDATLTNQALGKMSCLRRVLLTGTPMQNHLDEFYAMVNFTNPGVFGTVSTFRKQFERPILRGREPDATEADCEKGQAAGQRMSDITNGFILRRTNNLLSQFLPPKVVQVVCCKMTDMQVAVYNHFLSSKTAARLLRDGVAKDGEGAKVLSAITALKKLSNHPKLIYDCIHSSDKKKQADGFEDCAQFFPPGVFDDGRPGRSGRGGCAPGWEMTSGKMAVLSRLLHTLRTETTDRIVIISNYTQTLELLRQLCVERSYPYVMIDGQCSQKKRKKMCGDFNDMTTDQFVFLLSSKAGGCGLNLVGGNRLVLFDPDWNPATDKQAMARVWRDGQKKRVFLYRFVSTGTIEEKVLQRQLSKEGLQGVVDSSRESGSAVSTSMFGEEDLRDIFSYKGEYTVSDTHDTLNCERCTEESDELARAHREAGGCGNEGQADAERPLDPAAWERQVQEPGMPVKEEDLSCWAHHHSVANLPDPVMRRVAGDDVSFIFSCQVDGMEVEYSTYSRTGAQAAPMRQMTLGGGGRVGAGGGGMRPGQRPGQRLGPGVGPSGAGGSGLSRQQAPLNLPRPSLGGGMRRPLKPLHGGTNAAAAAGAGAARGGAVKSPPPAAKARAAEAGPSPAAATKKRRVVDDDDSDDDFE